MMTEGTGIGHYKDKRANGARQQRDAGVVVTRRVFYEGVRTEGPTCTWLGRQGRACGQPAKYHLWQDEAWPVSLAVPHYCCTYHFHFLRHRRELTFVKVRPPKNNIPTWHVTLDVAVPADDEKTARCAAAAFLLTNAKRGGLTGKVKLSRTNKHNIVSANLQTNERMGEDEDVDTVPMGPN